MLDAIPIRSSKCLPARLAVLIRRIGGKMPRQKHEAQAPRHIGYVIPFLNHEIRNHRVMYPQSTKAKVR